MQQELKVYTIKQTSSYLTCIFIQQELKVYTIKQTSWDLTCIFMQQELKIYTIKQIGWSQDQTLRNWKQYFLEPKVTSRIIYFVKSVQ